MLQIESGSASRSEARPKRRSALGVAALLDRLEEADAASATLQVPVARQNSPHNRRSNNGSHVTARKPQLGEQ